MKNLDNSVPVEIGGQTRHLIPTITAARKVSRLGPGYQTVLQKLLQLDHDTFAGVAAAGLEHDRTISSKDLDEAVYEAGIMNLVGDFITFVRCLSNGGKLDKPDEDRGSQEGEAQPGND